VTKKGDFYKTVSRRRYVENKWQGFLISRELYNLDSEKYDLSKLIGVYFWVQGYNSGLKSSFIQKQKSADKKLLGYQKIIFTKCFV